MPAEPICLASALPDEYFNYQPLSRGRSRKSEAFGRFLVSAAEMPGAVLVVVPRLCIFY